MDTRRRLLIAVVTTALATPLASLAQQPKKIWRIGYLGDGTLASRGTDFQEFRAGLEDLGYVQGRNIIIDSRWTEGKHERRAFVAEELVRLRVDIIVTHGVPATLAAKAATTTIPIVVAVAADLIGTGIVASLSRPGGNVTGMTDQVTDLAAKEVELLKEVMPKLQLAAVIWESNNPGAARTSDETQAAARALGVGLQLVQVKTLDEIEPAFDAAVKRQAAAVIVIHSPLTVGNRVHIAQLALKKQLPMVGAPTQFTEAGGLMSYGPDLTKYFRRAAVFVDKIIKGTRPGDIPVEQPTKFELVINMKTAKALGITFPQSVLIRADKVIQ